MVRWLFQRVAAPVRGLHQAAYLLAALTLASQLLALLRDRTFAHTFGAGPVLDFYYAAFRVPDVVFALVSSLVSAYVIIPRITNLDRERTRELLSESATFLLVVGGGICVVLAIIMPFFLAWLYPEFYASPHRGALVLLARLLLLQPILLGLSGVLASVTQVHRRFVLFAFSPVLYNLGIILGTVFLYPMFGLVGIGIGVIGGAVAYVLVNVPVVLNAGVFPRFRWPRFSVMAPIVHNSVPRSLALGVGSFVALALTAIASRLGSGSVSVYTLASNLEAVPLALIGSSYAVAAFPALSEASELNNREDFTRILSASARHIVVWSLVSLGLIVVLRAYLVRVILGSGAFGWDATRLTAALLALLAVGLAAQGLVLLFSRALYAARQSWRPLLYQLIGATLTVGLAASALVLSASGFSEQLARLLRVGSVPGHSVLFLAAAYSIGQIAVGLMALLALRTAAPGLFRALVRPVWQGLVVAVVSGGAAYGMLLVWGGIAPLTSVVAVFTQGFVAGIVGLAAAAGGLFVLKNDEFRDIVRAFSKLVRARASTKTILSPSADEITQP